MSRRVSLPGADELFRVTGSQQPSAAPEANAHDAAAVLATAATEAADWPAPAPPTRLEAPGPAPRHAPRRRNRGERRPSGRERHDEKITVYCSAEELIDLEQARLTLRGEHGLAVDRGRIVREAVAVVIADLEAKGEESILVRRLRGL